MEHTVPAAAGAARHGYGRSARYGLLGAALLFAQLLEAREGRAEASRPEDGSAASVRLEMPQWVSGWTRSAPSALHASRSGPFWTRRLDEDTVVLEGASPDRSTRELRRARARVGHPPSYFEPDLVIGPGAAEMLYRDDELLRADHDVTLSETLGYADWEFYSAARNSTHLFAAAFGIFGDGASYVALTGGGMPPLATELRPYRQGVWAPRALASPTHVFVVFRGVMVRPQRGYGLAVESMAIDALRSGRSWQPARSQYQPSGAAVGYGDPAATLDDAGQVHWAAVIWDNQRYIPTGRIVVDGVELQHRGMAGNVDWVPELCWVRGRGLVLAIAGTSGSTQVGEVHGNQFSLLAELPSVPPAYGEPPPTRLASYGESFYVSTSEGLWAHQVAERVPVAGSLVGWIALGLLGVATVARGRSRGGARAHAA